MKKVVRKLAAKDMLGISLSGLNELARLTQVSRGQSSLVRAAERPASSKRS
jgi:hypothetical protein